MLYKRYYALNSAFKKWKKLYKIFVFDFSKKLKFGYVNDFYYSLTKQKLLYKKNKRNKT